MVEGATNYLNPAPRIKLFKLNEFKDYGIKLHAFDQTTKLSSKDKLIPKQLINFGCLNVEFS